MKQIISIILVLPFFALTQNEWKDVDSKDFIKVIQEFENSIPKGESYSMLTSYDIYENYSSNVPVHTSKGRLLCRNGNELNVFQLGIIMIQDANLNLTIDTINQQIVIQKPDSSFFYRKTAADVSAFAELTNRVQKKELLGKLIYSLELKKGYPYSAVDLEFSSNNMISRITIYSNQPYLTNDYNNSEDKAKVVIGFDEFIIGKKVDLKEFKNIEDFVIIKDEMFISIGKYADYEVIDLRN